VLDDDGRIHNGVRMTPAMAAGIPDHVWSLEEIAALAPEPVAKKRGPYRKRQSALASALSKRYREVLQLLLPQTQLGDCGQRSLKKDMNCRHSC
jgi:hypothetical protein